MECEPPSDIPKVNEMNHNEDVITVEGNSAAKGDTQISDDIDNTAEMSSDIREGGEIENIEFQAKNERNEDAEDDSSVIANEHSAKSENYMSQSESCVDHKVKTDSGTEEEMMVLCNESKVNDFKNYEIKVDDNDDDMQETKVATVTGNKDSDVQEGNNVTGAESVDISDNATGPDIATCGVESPAMKKICEGHTKDATQKEEIAFPSAEPASTSSSSPSPKSSVMQSIYFLKKLKFNGEHIQIVTQNENGPCPLLAIANVLAISKRIALPSMQECITASQLMEYIGDYILTVAPKNADEQFLLNYQQNMHDAISIMHKLQTGIDVNVKFTGPRDFEFTSECLVFDLLNIGLYHGWLVDPQDMRTVTAIGSLSYNQLVEKIIKSKEANATEEMISEGLLAENFLEGTASQLTYHGLCELNSAICEEELCVFFRNNHFSTLYKRKGELFLLVTDQGYLNQSRIIWETLANVDGAGHFVDENFHTVGPLSYQAPAAAPKPNETVPEDQLTQEDKDYLIALSLQEDAQVQRAAKPTNVDPANQAPRINAGTTLTPAQLEANDLALAQRLQNEEEQYARQQQLQQNQHAQQVRQPHGQFPYHQQHQPTQNEFVGRGHSEPRSSEKCTIL